MITPVNTGLEQGGAQEVLPLTGDLLTIDSLCRKISSFKGTASTVLTVFQWMAPFLEEYWQYELNLVD